MTGRRGDQATERKTQQPGRRRVLPEDPLVRWLIWLMLFVSVGAPALAALVLLVVQ